MESSRRLHETKERKPLQWRCDAALLRKWLNKRKASLETVRQEFEPLWKELRLYFEPDIGKALLNDDNRDAASSRREDEKIIHSIPRDFVHRYAAGMQSGITNKSDPWCMIVPKGLDIDVDRDLDLHKWCNDATERIRSALERGNFYLTSHQAYLHGGLMGTTCVMIFRGDEPGDITFKLIDEGDYWIAEDKRGDVNVVMRRISMTLAQARDEFLLSRLPEAWQRKLEEGKEEERVIVWNLICPNDGSEKFADIGTNPWASIYWIEEQTSTGGDNCGILDITSYSYKPMAVFRHMNTGSVYGSGIGVKSLPDNKELQALEKCLERMIHNEENPAMVAPSSMKGRAINMHPGGITFYDGVLGNGTVPIQRLFETHESIADVLNHINTIVERIGNYWYSNLFAMMLNLGGHGKQMTATEIAERSGEKVTLLGPVLTQMDEFLNVVIEAVLIILLEDGFIPPAPAALIQGSADISVEYTSTIHQEMKAAAKMKAIYQISEMAAMLGQAKPTAIDKINEDKMIDEIGRIYPAAAAFIYKDREVAKIRASRKDEQQQMIQGQQYVEMMKNAGQNVKALSEAQLSQGSALDAVMGGM